VWRLSHPDCGSVEILSKMALLVLVQRLDQQPCRYSIGIIGWSFLTNLPTGFRSAVPVDFPLIEGDVGDGSLHFGYNCGTWLQHIYAFCCVFGGVRIRREFDCL
jgi:hypothetical protein